MKLGEYLETEGIKRKVFAQKIAVSPATLDNIVSGHDTLISTGLRIQRETRGNVKIAELAPTKPRRSKAKKNLETIQTNP